jgi:hypothetical protein
MQKAAGARDRLDAWAAGEALLAVASVSSISPAAGMSGSTAPLPANWSQGVSIALPVEEFCRAALESQDRAFGDPVLISVFVFAVSSALLSASPTIQKQI